MANIYFIFSIVITIIFSYYNIANIERKKSNIYINLIFFSFQITFIGAILNYVFNLKPINENLNILYNFIKYFLEDIDLNKILFIILASILLHFINKIIKSNFIILFINLVCFSIIFYFATGLLFANNYTVANSQLYNLLNEITNSKIVGIKAGELYVLNEELKTLSFIFLFTFLTLSFSPTPSIYFMTSPKCTIKKLTGYNYISNYTIKLFILIINFLINNKEKKIFKIKNNKNEFLNLKKRILINNIKKEKISLSNFKKEIEKKIIQDENYNINKLNNKTKLFKFFKFINHNFYIFLMRKKEYLLIASIFIEMINNMKIILNLNKNEEFNNVLISQNYCIFILILFLISFKNKNILKFFKLNREQIVFNILLITLMLILQYEFYKIIEVNIFNIFIIAILYSMRDSIFKNTKIDKKSFFIILFYTLNNISIIYFSENISLKESIIFFNSILIIMTLKKDTLKNLMIPKLKNKIE